MSTHLVKKLAASSGDITCYARTSCLHQRRQVGEMQIFDRDALEPGFNAAGLAIIEEYGSTTLV
jgi:hypothetical protein